MAQFWSAVINGVAPVPVMVMMHLASRSKIMGRFTFTWKLKTMRCVATAEMAAAAIGMLATLGRDQ